MSASIEACLPSDLRGATTTITKVAAGLSGAGVYRVESHGESFVLKISDASQPLAAWQETVRIRQLAADAGVAPRIVHVDEARRAILSEFVVDRSFRMYYWDPRTHDTAIERLGQLLRRVHDIPLPADVEAKDARGYLERTWTGFTGFRVPSFVGSAVRQVLDEEPPPSGRAVVLSHNDVNPTNVVYDGERLLLFDWETAGPNDPFYDLAAVSVFLRMDDATCLELISAHDGEPASRLPARFLYDRRLAAVFCGVMFLHLARQRGHAGAEGTETLDSVPMLGEFYKQLMTGAVNIGSAEGQWTFGLALVREGIQR